MTIDVAQGQTLVLEKLAYLYTSRDNAISECGLAARKAMARAGRFEAVKADHLRSLEAFVAALRCWHPAC